MLEQVAQRSSGCPIPGVVQGQVGWGSEQHDVVKDVPAHSRGVGLDGLQRPNPNCSMINLENSGGPQLCLTAWVQPPERGLKEAAPLTLLFLCPTGCHHGGAGSEVAGPQPYCVLHHGSRRWGETAD